MKIIELRPNRELLNVKFETYLYDQNVFFQRKFDKKLQTEILRLEPDSSQDSLLEAKLFAYHNHLFRNPYDSTCWFIDNDGQVWCFNNEDSSLQLKLDKAASIKLIKSVYNPSIGFGSQNVISVTNGGGILELFIEGNGRFNHFLFEDIEAGVIFDTSVKDEPLSIKLVKKQILKVKGSINHVYIEKNGQYCNIIGSDQIEFEYDSVNPIKSEDNDSNTDSLIKIPRYYWSQDEDSLTVYMKIPDTLAQFSEKVKTTSLGVDVTIEDVILLKGETPYRLEPNLTTFKRDKDTLQVELIKAENGLMWNELIKGDTGGEYLPNEALAAEVHAKLAHLCSDEIVTREKNQPSIGFNTEQLEECDLNSEENILQRIDLKSNSISHLVMLGINNRVLFAENQSTGMCICLRHDNDGCIWNTVENENDWDLKHSFTFPGFGYIEASKTNKKFCIAPFDRSIVLIIEWARHALLYERPKKNATVGRQAILDFENGITQILGAVAFNQHLIILTKDSLLQMEICL
ncbi:nudC domain-containing protein 1 isoform X2 [Trichogramma pretiosum]|uniref:nudC domain-containing protein 1 isoform X2 n=1 Tax=Trichogramma pretiosum TaxID=7493 RepID=UPI000C719016|nr:nudC domain-containing protein 1 isoform X2 [Trichogramma pretiosum]